MEIVIHEQNGQKIAQIAGDSVIISNEQDALDLMVDPRLMGARRIIIGQKNIIPDFFKLRTRIAGGILQKFVTYRVKLAIIGDFKNISSDTFKAFAYESNRGNDIFFVESINAAKAKLFAAK